MACLCGSNINNPDLGYDSLSQSYQVPDLTMSYNIQDKLGGYDERE